MDQKDVVIAHLHRLDPRMKRIGASTLRLLALGLFAAMICSCRALDILS